MKEENQPAIPRDPGSRLNLRSVDRCVAILFAFSKREPELNLTELAARAGLDAATALRYARALCDARLLRRSPSGSYALGFALVELGQACLSSLDVRDIAIGHMRRIRDELNETVLLFVRSGRHRVCIEQVEGFKDIRRTGSVGNRTVLHLGSPSKVLLANLPRAEQESYLDWIEQAGADEGPPLERSALEVDLKQVLLTGYSETLNELGMGGAGVSAPIYNRTGEVIAALNVSASIDGWPAIRDRARTLVVGGAAEISAEMGYAEDPDHDG
jgi:IclR family KDG regulon transcriptional repressor